MYPLTFDTQLDFHVAVATETRVKVRGLCYDGPGEMIFLQQADSAVPLFFLPHYHNQGHELGWHFDNSAFAVTLMIQPPENGGVFEYVPALRDHGSGDMNFEGVGEVLDGDVHGTSLDIRAGTLALFRGRNSLHRVTPTLGDTLRIQVVMAYNTEPGVGLSEQARITFYGRTH